MATFTNTNRTSYGTITVSVSESTGSTTTNTSPIAVTIQYTSSGQYYMGITDFDVYDSQGNYLIDSYTRSYGVVSGISKGTVTIKTWSSLTAYHEDDGSGSLTIAMSYRIGNSTVYSDTFSMTLSTIARASSITLGSSSLAISGTSGTLAYTITSKADFYHKVIAKVSSSSTVLSGQEIDTTTYSGTIDYTTILSCIPSANTGTLTVTCYTYSDSGMTTQIGSASATCSITVSILPTVTLSAISSSNTDLNLLVAGYTTASVTNTTTKPSGASSVTTYFTATNGTMATASTTSLRTTVSTKTLPANTSEDKTLTITAYAIDSRGNQSSSVSVTGTIYAYTAPTITYEIYRTSNSSGTPEADEAGTYVYCYYYGTYTSLTGNTGTDSATFNGTSISSGSFTSLSETSTAEVIITAADLVTSVTQTVNVPVAIYAVDIYDAGSGDVGFAVGGISRSGYMDNFLIGTGDYYYDAENGASIDLCSDGYVILTGIAGSTSQVAVTVFLPKLIGSLTPTVTATASWIRGAGSTQTAGTVTLDAYSSNWVRLLVSGSLTQYQIYAVLFSALTISFS